MSAEAQPDTASSPELDAALRSLGISEAASRLDAPGYSPESCIEGAKKSLWFWGSSGAKWVADKGRFEKLLGDVQKSGGSVRFLLLDPEGSTLGKLRSMQDRPLGPDPRLCIQYLASLRERFSALEVAFYDHLPCFRMVFVDDDFLVVSHYMLSPAGQFSSSLGWDLPQLKLKREAPWPFYEAFKRSFELAWRAARNAGPFELVELTMDEPTAGGMVEDRCMQLALADLLGTQPANVRRVETE